MLSQTSGVRSSSEATPAGATLWVRRHPLVSFHPKRKASIELEQLLSGNANFAMQESWEAISPTAESPIELPLEDVTFLLTLSSLDWMPTTSCDSTETQLSRLARAGLIELINDLPSENSAESVTNEDWWPPAAACHLLGRWQGINSIEAQANTKTKFIDSIVQQRGTPPQPIRNDTEASIELPYHEQNEFDLQLAKRATCRNFDVSRAIPLETLSRILKRALGAQHVVYHNGQVVTLKKNVPAGGGFHCVEGYVIAQNVTSIQPGIYHYDTIAHSLMRMRNPDIPLRDFCKLAVAQQHYFADASVLLVLVPNFQRLHWKYRSHSKAFKVTSLDTGHISQMLFLCAQEEGLGAFVTAAINEVDIERALDLHPLQASPTAVCGLGWRKKIQEEPEFDPNEMIWRK